VARGQAGVPVATLLVVSDPTADRIALRNLVDSYAVGCDRRDIDLLQACFAPGATNTVHWLDRAATTMTAPHDLERIPKGLARYDRTFHFVGNHVVTLDGDRASGDAYCFAHHITGTNDFIMAIRYEDVYARTAAGWRIATRDLRLLWTADQPVN
jgi:hypothetical protein